MAIFDAAPIYWCNMMSSIIALCIIKANEMLAAHFRQAIALSISFSKRKRK
jgi:hypothetical protein